MGKQLTLDEIKTLERKLLCAFADFCDENGISYFLSNGTLLGAVKYGGFIPWDDDVDVLVPRRDYDKLMKLFSDGNGVTLLARERNPDYRYPFAKLCYNAAVLVEENMEDALALGVNIDIFPLDAWADKRSQACRQVRRNKLRTKLLFHVKMKQFATEEGHSLPGRLLRKTAHRICKWISAGRICDGMMREAIRYRREPHPRNLGCVVWPVYGEQEILPAEVFETAVAVEFEGRSYPAPGGYDRYLKSLYGDYTKNLPPEQQVTHHKFKAYWRGNDGYADESK